MYLSYQHFKFRFHSLIVEMVNFDVIKIGHHALMLFAHGILMMSHYLADSNISKLA